MPTLDFYRRSKSKPVTIGQIHKMQSDMIMDATWNNDINSRVGWFYDMYHDPNPRLLRGLNPEKDKTKCPIDIKFIQHTSQTLDKDNVSFHLQFRPGQQCPLPYYQEYVDLYEQEWPLGCYVDIENESGRWDRWLIVAKANAEGTQFPTYELLKCDYTFQYIMDNIKMEVAGVLRSQNSYNSGIWTDYRITSVEDQQKFVVPLNRDTERLWYNLRMIIDSKVLAEQRAWKISKVNRLSPNGVVRVTLAEDMFNDQTDYIELDKNGVVVGMWADYYQNGQVTPVAPSEDTPSIIYSKITYSGTKPEIKIGGSFKKFTVTFYDDGEPTTHIKGDWKFAVDSVDVSNLIKMETISDNQCKIKFIGDYEYIGKVLVVSYESVNGIKSSTEMNIVGI